MLLEWLLIRWDDIQSCPESDIKLDFRSNIHYVFMATLLEWHLCRILIENTVLNVILFMSTLLRSSNLNYVCSIKCNCLYFLFLTNSERLITTCGLQREFPKKGNFLTFVNYSFMVIKKWQKWVIRSKQLRKSLFDDDETIEKWMLPGHHLSGTKILKRAKLWDVCPTSLREAMNAILGRFRLPAVAKNNIAYVKVTVFNFLTNFFEWRTYMSLWSFSSLKFRVHWFS